MTAGSAPRVLTVAVLGLGETGGAIARDLAAGGARVRGYDPAVPAPPGVTAAASDLLEELSVPPRVARASQQWLNELATET